MFKSQNVHRCKLQKRIQIKKLRRNNHFNSFFVKVKEFIAACLFDFGYFGAMLVLKVVYVYRLIPNAAMEKAFCSYIIDLQTNATLNCQSG